MAYTSGFNPHPRISYANAVPTGAASEAEYLELGLAKQVVAEELADVLNSALPDGFEIVEVGEATGGALSELLEASMWRIQVEGISNETLQRAVDSFLAEESVEVSRMTKQGMRDFDARAAVERLSVTDDKTLELIIRHQVPLVRPDDVLTAMTGLEPGMVVVTPPVLTRIAQGRLISGRVLGPLHQ